MWPPNRRSALAEALQFELAVEGLLGAGISRWRPSLADAVPSLTAAGNELPPDPDAILAQQGTWDAVADTLISAGLSVLFAVATFRAVEALDGDLADHALDDEDLPEDTTDAIGVIAASTGITRSAMRSSTRRLAASSLLRSAMADYVADTLPRVKTIPGSIHRSAMSAMIAGQTEKASAAELRVTVTKVLAVDSPEWADISRGLSREEAAGVQNAGVLQAGAMQNAGGAELEKTWISTIDSRTRPTHWAADGQRAPLSGTFRVGHEDLRFPGDPRGSSKETGRCRCRVAVLAVDEALPSESDRHTERGPGDSTVANRSGSQADEIERRAENGNIRARDDEDGLGEAGLTADGGTMKDTTARKAVTAAADEETAAETYRTFTDAPIALLGTPTSDGRILSSDIKLKFRSFPEPLMWTEQTSYGHEDAYTVGVIETASVDGDKVIASGYLLNTEAAEKAAEALAHGVTGPSVDLGDTEWEMTKEDGSTITEEEWWDLPEDEKVYMTIVSAELMGATLVATPAFGDTKITLNSERETREVGLVAAAAATVTPVYVPEVYDSALFENPNFTEPTLPTISDDGRRIFGHLACFGECHAGIQNECTMAPHSIFDYAFFKTAPAVRLSNGQLQPVGRLTTDCGHADDRLGMVATQAHYDDAGACFALVNVGEDEFGVWFSGVPAPGASRDQIARGMSAPLSGDWRERSGNLELCAALAVNTPGFRVPTGRTNAYDRPVTLVASLGPRPRKRGAEHILSTEQVRLAAQEAVNAILAHQRQEAEVAALLAKVPDSRLDEQRAIIASVNR